jgi:hypothetical protein
LVPGFRGCSPSLDGTIAFGLVERQHTKK